MGELLPGEGWPPDQAAGHSFGHLVVAEIPPAHRGDEARREARAMLPHQLPHRGGIFPQVVHEGVALRPDDVRQPRVLGQLAKQGLRLRANHLCQRRVVPQRGDDLVHRPLDQLVREFLRPAGVGASDLGETLPLLGTTRHQRFGRLPEWREQRAPPQRPDHVAGNATGPGHQATGHRGTPTHRARRLVKQADQHILRVGRGGCTLPALARTSALPASRVSPGRSLLATRSAPCHHCPRFCGARAPVHDENRTARGLRGRCG
jgi:hypothetical protein